MSMCDKNLKNMTETTDYDFGETDTERKILRAVLSDPILVERYEQMAFDFEAGENDLVERAIRLLLQERGYL